MARRTYDPEVKAAVMAALLAGQSVSEVAKEYRIPKGTVSGWKKRGVAKIATQKKETDSIGDLLVEAVCENLRTLKVQAETFRDPEWLKNQSAAEAATLYGVMSDKTVRMIEAFGEAS